MGKQNKAKEPDRILTVGQPNEERCDNQVISARYTAWSFLPVATVEQFRRFANMYFLVVGVVMAIGYYSTLYESAISPWTTLGPLAFVVSISLLVQGSADLKRHRNDSEMNNALCVILRRADELEGLEDVQRDENVMKGRDVVVNINKAYYTEQSKPARKKQEQSSETTNGSPVVNVNVAFQKIRRMDIRQGHFILVKNREMVPADMVLLASSNEGGSAYIETMSIDGETNLKLRTSPHLPASVLRQLRGSTVMETIGEEEKEDEEQPVEIETIDAATKRLTRFSYLGWPQGASVLDHPNYRQKQQEEPIAPDTPGSRGSSLLSSIYEKFSRPPRRRSSASIESRKPQQPATLDSRYIAALTTEPPNPSVHTFSGKLTLPPFEKGGECYDIPLGADNVLLRGAVVRNTEWVIGLAFFTGTDTKLIQNSFETPSKFSQLDQLMNYCVVAILVCMFCILCFLATMATTVNNVRFHELFYTGFNKNMTEPWPYLPHLEPPKWETSTYNWLQFFLLFITLLNNFVPLSLYVSVEFVTWCSLWFIYADLDMYDDTTDTRAVARSTIVSDLGRVQYIFSDKTGTLTQNVMRFKRCSVDGLMFGTPIEKSAPGVRQDGPASFHPLRQLLVGRFQLPRSAGLEGLGDSTQADNLDPEEKLTFNAEMFLRVMSLCHTVVVEKDIDNKDCIDGGTSAASGTSGGLSAIAKGLFKRKTSDQHLVSPLSTVSEDGDSRVSGMTEVVSATGKVRCSSVESLPPGFNQETEKAPDGAPYGYAYQAESPDEGALVSAASKTFGFQVIGRDSSGIRLRTNKPSHLHDEAVVSGLKEKTLSLKRLSAETARELDGGESSGTDLMDRSQHTESPGEEELREESWAILAVNKFDSDRKRMSILLRSPRELGGLPILFCKGADSAMLDPEVCAMSSMLQTGGEMSQLINRPSVVGNDDRDVSALSTVSEDDLNDRVDEDGWEIAQMLGLQSHLGDFAREGLRTLVLGMKVLSELECSLWLEQYKVAASSIKDRSALLTEAAKAIERDIHIVGATAIEDKLQRGVPETIATLEKAGIKLWVLTGDKRETAVEIGYSTHVLTPKMHLTQVPDNGKHHVRTQMSMEFIRLVKMGKLPWYQKVSVDGAGPRTMKRYSADITFSLGKLWRYMKRCIRSILASILHFVGGKGRSRKILAKVKQSEEAETNIMKDVVRRRLVRDKADEMIRLWLEQEGKQKKVSGHFAEDHGADDLSLTSEETPLVFNRASSAKELLKSLRATGTLSSNELRKLSLANLTAQQAADDEPPVVDEDALSLQSFFPENLDDLKQNFDKRKRTLLERLFAIDKEVRKGKLVRHLRRSKMEAVLKQANSDRSAGEGPGNGPQDGPRALVIEGSALKHLLGNPQLEEILFAVASSCDAVIACRVSPKQKALLVNLVRQNITPEPITLSIGDGANDVGMIQEAHIGVGISGKEGRQAVNASDFAIAQFRFLEELVLVHGRWNFFRVGAVVLFSFYKNALMAGILIAYSSQNVYSGTPLFDQWLIAMLNFVAGMPIVLLGLFDRYLSKDYVRKNPEVYKATRQNEVITFRILSRWIFLVVVHILTLYYLTVPQQSFGGGMTSAWEGLMANESRDAPGDGEGGDLKSVGTVTFSSMIFLLAYKVLFESKSLVHGIWPSFTCSKDKGEGFPSRLAYTWHGVIFVSIGFYLWAIAIYQSLGRWGPSSFSLFVNQADHMLGTRSLSWLILLFIPLAAQSFDLIGKVYGNLFFPTQSQIHLEIESQGKREAKRRRRAQKKNDNDNGGGRTFENVDGLGLTEM